MRISSIFDKIGSLNDLPEIVELCLKDEQVVKTPQKIEYFNVPCAFDIETTSFYENGEKRAVMYEWTLGINNAVIIGRTWEEFVEALDVISRELDLSKNRRVVIYVHNLSFEFQFMRKWLQWENVFATDDRKPVYALTNTGIEFRCSYILSGCSLETIGNNLKKYKVEKLVGFLDYSKPRHAKTPLTKKEIAYCVNDVRVVMAYIAEKMEMDGDATKIPLTKTGYVRRYCRNSCFGYKGNKQERMRQFYNYHELMLSLTITPDEYTQLKNAFQGGFTHANAFYTGKTIADVGSYDFNSSYPAVMISEQFPMSKSEIVKIDSLEEFEKNLHIYCCLFDVYFEGFESTTLYEHPLSASRCCSVVGSTEDNGRIVEAKSLKTTLTEQDFFIIRRFYRWEKMKIGTFRRYRKGYLPTEFIKAILKLYGDKTTLKGVGEKEIEYSLAKEMLNSCYGMSVTDICREKYVYTGDRWEPKTGNIETEINRTNRSKSRFLFYPWGVWVTAYARRNLFSGIYEFKNDYIYSDTDSVKGINIANHLRYIERYNEVIIYKLERALSFHGIEKSAIRPKTIKGIEKPLGVWEFEGFYNRFKTLGAKRYMTEKDGNISITVSGVNKKVCVPYLYQNFGNRWCFEAFDENLVIPPEYTGKLTHTYIDEPMDGVLVDYKGQRLEYHEKSGVHLEQAGYSLSMSSKYLDYFKGLQKRNG